MGAIASVLSLILTLFQLLILARVLLSWVPQMAYNSDPTVRQIIRVIYDLTEPVLAPIRQLMPQGSMVDFSPLIVLLIIYVIQNMVLR